MNRLIVMTFFLILAFSVTGCVSTSKHRQEVRDDSGEKISVGTVQREIKVGMSSAEVIEALGSPNMVSTDAERREVWVWDKISTEHIYSTSSGGVSALILGGAKIGGGVGGGMGGGSYDKSTGASSTNQRTMTIIVKFDKESKVRDFAYRQTSF